jgi:hypothetical protein
LRTSIHPHTVATLEHPPNKRHGVVPQRPQLEVLYCVEQKVFLLSKAGLIDPTYLSLVTYVDPFKNSRLQLTF